MLTQSELKENLYYSIITGHFYWLKPRQSIKVGNVAGVLNSSDYRCVGLGGKLYLAHRLAWFWVTGKWPKNMIDHKNGITDANYWLNLREATNSQNQWNRGLMSTNTSGFNGVHWQKVNQKWVAQIKLNKKNKHLGLFDDIELAYAARLKAEKELHGDFARI